MPTIVERTPPKKEAMVLCVFMLSENKKPVDSHFEASTRAFGEK
jgi:hypothetical protein